MEYPLRVLPPVYNCSTDCYHTSFVTPLLQKPTLPLDFLPEHVIVEASTRNQGGHGLLCCSNHSSGPNMRYYVCKPTTREWAPLPCPNSRTSTINMGMCIVTVGNPPVLKIVRLSTRRKTNKCSGYKFNAYYTEVFDSAEWDWERLPSGADFDFKRFSFTSDAALFMCRSFYWFEFPSLIVCFDLETNEWSHVKLPEALSINNETGSTCNVDLNLVIMNGKLTLLVQDANLRGNPQIDVWVMVNKVSQYWAKKESLKLVMEGEASFLGFFASDVALVAQSKVTGLNDIYWYDTVTDKCSAREKELRFIFIRPFFPVGLYSLQYWPNQGCYPFLVSLLDWRMKFSFPSEFSSSLKCSAINE